MELIFLLVWSIVGLVYIVNLEMSRKSIPNKDKYRLVVLFSGPIVWVGEIILFVLSALKPLFTVIDEWVNKE